MKRALLALLFAAVIALPAAAFTLVVPQGPTKLLFDRMGSGDLRVARSLEEIVALAARGECDACVLSLPVGMGLEKKGTVTLGAVIDWDVFSLLFRSDNSGSLLLPFGKEEAASKSLVALFPESTDVQYAPPAQIAMLLLAGRGNAALLPEPFASKTWLENADTLQRTSLRRLWRERFPETPFVPTGIFVPTGKTMDETTLRHAVEEFRGAANLTLPNGALSADAEQTTRSVLAADLRIYFGDEARTAAAAYLTALGK